MLKNRFYLIGNSHWSFLIVIETQLLSESEIPQVQVDQTVSILSKKWVFAATIWIWKMNYDLNYPKTLQEWLKLYKISSCLSEVVEKEYMFKEVYSGSFQNDLRDGFGKYNYTKGYTYEGQWKEGKKDGVGILSNSHYYIGKHFLSTLPLIHRTIQSRSKSKQTFKFFNLIQK